MKNSRFTDSQIIDALKRAAVPELCRELGISAATFYKWRTKFGGMDASLMARMKELGEESRRLRKMYIEEKLKAAVVAQRGLSIRLACQAFRISQACYRYKAQRCIEEDELAQWLLRLTDNNRSWGCGLCFLYLRNVRGFKWNHKRVCRIYRELELNLCIRPRKRLD